MPLRKFRSIEGMNAQLPARQGGDAAENLRVALALSDFCYSLHPVRMPAGLRKYRSIEEMRSAREAWELAVATRRRESAP